MKIRTTLDNQSRLAVCCDSRAVLTAVDVVTSFRKVAAKYGFPASPLSDNGAMLTGASRGGGRVAPEHESPPATSAFGTRTTNSAVSAGCDAATWSCW